MSRRILVQSGAIEAEPAHLFGNARGRPRQRLRTRHGIELRLASLLQVPHATEGFSDGRSNNQRAVISQNQHHVVAQISRKTGSFVQA